MSRLRIALVEDNDDHAELVETVAESTRGLVGEFLRFRTMAEALAELPTSTVDLVLLDLSLDDSSIKQTLERLPEIVRSVAAPVVVLTSLDDRDIGSQAIKAGAQDYLSKHGLTGQRLGDVCRYAVERHVLKAELQTARDELQKQAEELARSNDELEQFAYVASHDLQEPLRMVTSFAALLEDELGELTPKAKQYLGFVTEGAERMQKLIAGLLAFSRVDREVNFVTHSASAALDGAILQLTEVIRESGANITRDPLPDVFADQLLLAQLFQNLLSNAIKFCKTTPEIRVSCERVAEAWKFSVADNGIGFEANHATRIFQMFKRLHSRDAFEGAGIGLAIAAKIVTTHHGEIWAESKPGDGTTFFFTLPQAD